MSIVTNEPKTERISFRVTPTIKKEIDKYLNSCNEGKKRQDKYTITDYMVDLLVNDFEKREGGTK